MRSFHVPATPGTSGLTAELSFGTDFAGDAGHLRGERAELLHHGVDGVLELEDLALHVNGDLLRQVAVGDGRCHLRDLRTWVVRLECHHAKLFAATKLPDAKIFAIPSDDPLETGPRDGIHYLRKQRPPSVHDKASRPQGCSTLFIGSAGQRERGVLGNG